MTSMPEVIYAHMLALRHIDAHENKFNKGTKYIRADKYEEAISALKMAKKELLIFKDDAFCEHEVGVCSCIYWRTLEAVDKAINNFKGVE